MNAATIKIHPLALVVFGVVVGWFSMAAWLHYRKPAATDVYGGTVYVQQASKIDSLLMLELTRLDSQGMEHKISLDRVNKNLLQLKKTNDEKIDFLRTIPADQSFRIFAGWLSDTSNLGE